jgi:hypothetical protein
MPDLFTLKVDVAQVAAAGKHFAEAKAKMPSALAHAVATIGPQATSAMKKVLPGQTGLKSKTINKALKGRSSGLTYVIRFHGGDIRLKYFGARETAKGVTAAPRNNRRLYQQQYHRKRSTKLGPGPAIHRPKAGEVVQRS